MMKNYKKRSSLSANELLEYQQLCDEGLLDELVAEYGGTHRDAYERYKGREGDQKELGDY